MQAVVSSPVLTSTTATAVRSPTTAAEGTLSPWRRSTKGRGPTLRLAGRINDDIVVFEDDRPVSMIDDLLAGLHRHQQGGRGGRGGRDGRNGLGGQGGPGRGLDLGDLSCLIFNISCNWHSNHRCTQVWTVSK